MNGRRSNSSRPATVQDVARLAEVSTATVSRVLNGSGPASDESRRRVNEAVRRLDYVANLHAKTLQPQARSRAWGLLIDDVDSHYFGRLVAELDRAAQDVGSTLFTTSTQKQWDREQHLIREMRGRRMDGLLVVQAAREGHETGEELTAPPLVYIDRIPRGLSDAEVVTFDYYRAITEEMTALWRRGHRSFSFIGGNVGADPGARRLAAFTDFLHEHGVAVDPASISAGHSTEDEAAAALRSMLDAEEPPTAIVTTHSPLLLGVLRVVMERRPAVEILASEEIAAAFLSPVPLHIIASDPGLLAREASERLQRRIDGAPTEPGVTLLETQVLHFGPQEELPA